MMSKITYFIGGGLVGSAIMGISTLIYNSKQAAKRVREKKNPNPKYYITHLNYSECLEFLNEYENVMAAFSLIYNVYTRGTDGYCMHDKIYQGCSECTAHSNNSFLCLLGNGNEKVYCTWLRTYVNPLRDAPVVNTVILPITLGMTNTIDHHHQIKNIVGKLRAFYDKYDNQLVNDSTYMKYRPYIIKYFEQYDADEIDITRDAQVSKFDASKIICDYEKKEQ